VKITRPVLPSTLDIREVVFAENQPATIALTQNQVALVDASWYKRLTAMGNWTAWWNPSTESFYAVATISGKRVYMHRLILGLTGFEQKGDHINLNTLDNRCENLRSCSHQQNCCNRNRPQNNTSGFKGVSRYRGLRWRAQIKLRGKYIHLGYFDNANHAALAYDEAAKKMFGEFAFLNFPHENSGYPRRKYSRQKAVC
jgi:hypothetical protein